MDRQIKSFLIVEETPGYFFIHIGKYTQEISALTIHIHHSLISVNWTNYLQTNKNDDH